jgi:hypothetical protein
MYFWQNLKNKIFTKKIIFDLKTLFLKNYFKQTLSKESKMIGVVQLLLQNHKKNLWSSNLKKNIYCENLMLLCLIL